MIPRLLADIAQDGDQAEARLVDCLALIAREDRRWHAMLALNPAARDEARAMDRRAAKGGTRGRLQGIPIALKDNIDLAGMATSSGCVALAQAMPRQDAEVVSLLRAAGAIIVGKTNLSEFSFEIRSRSSLGGDVLCPAAPWATAGGSSGGSAVAVARGFALAALGTDTGGSIRIPAACNGLVGFRPAHGVLPVAGVAPLAPSTDTVGIITRCIADARLLYDVMGGVVGKSPIAVRGVRLGVLHQAFGQDPSVIMACDAALAVLDQAGVECVPIVMAGLEPLLAGPHIVDAEFAAAFAAYLATNFLPGTAPPSLTELVAGGDFLPDHASVLHRRMDTPPPVAAILERHAELAAMLTAALQAQWLDGLVYPTMRVIPDSLANPQGGWAAELAARTGWPAICVPAPVPAEARSVGIELLFPAGREDMLFAVAAALETARAE